MFLSSTNTSYAGASPGGSGPVVTISGSSTADTTYTVTIAFAANVTGFVVGDITKTGTATATLSNFTAVSGSSYTVDVTPTTNGTVILSIAAAVCIDGFGRDNQASNTVTTTVTLLPINTVAPTISTTGSTVGSVLTVTSNGTWLNSPSSYTYQWQRDSVNISAATSSSYTTISADDGHAIEVVVTGVNGAGSSTARSNSVNIGFSANNFFLWLDGTDSTTASGISGDNDNVLRPSASIKGTGALSSSLISPGGLRTTPQYNADSSIYMNGQCGWTVGASSDLKFLHNGSDFTVYFLFKQLTVTTSTNPLVMFRTANLTLTGNSQVGIMIHYYNQGGKSTYHVSIANAATGITTPPYQIIGTGNEVSVGSWNIGKVVMSSGTLSVYNKVAGAGSFTLVGSDSTAGTPVSTANATAPLNVGIVTGGNKFYLKHFLATNSILNGSQTTTIESYLDAQALILATVSNVNVYLHAGQSNEGSASNTGIASDLNGKIGSKTFYLTGNSDSYKSGFWAEMELGVTQNPSTNLDTHGWQMRFSKNMNAINPTYMLGRWVGATILIYSPPGASWSAQNSVNNSDLYPYWLDGFYVTQGIGGVVFDGLEEIIHVKRKTPIIKGIILYVGETDSGISTTTQAAWASEGESFFTNTITKLSAAGYDVSGVRCVIPRVQLNGGVKNLEVRAAQADVINYLKTTYFADSTKATLIDCDSFTAAGGHLDAAGQDALGTALYNFFSPYA
jgi:hypothetical protein